MSIGTKSILFGAHCFFIHPFVLAIAWWKLYGFPWHPALWLCFIVHDWGYWGKPNMDGLEGEEHPLLGAKIVQSIFGDQWGEFCLLHSRWFAKRLNKPFSKLCVADKMVIVITPFWLYYPFVWMTGEIDEYMGAKRENKYQALGFDHSTPKAWFISVQKYLREWIFLHKDCDGIDQWMNGADVSQPTMSRLPGYLEGGYETDRYRVTKTIGLTNPKAKYMVFRYDKDQDPHAIMAILAYSISVSQDNEELAVGIISNLAKELDMTNKQFHERYRLEIAQMILMFNGAHIDWIKLYDSNRSD